MPLEPNPVTVGALLVAIVVATIGGGLVGRRLRTWNERRVARRAVATLAARQALPAPRPPRPVTAPTGGPVGVASTAAAGGSYLSRRLAGEPPPVFARRPSGLSPAVEMRAGQSVTATPTTAPRPRAGRRRRATIAVVLASLVFAVGAGLGMIASTAGGPTGAVLDVTGTPGAADVGGTVIPGDAGAGSSGASVPPAESDAPTRLPLVVAATDAPSATADGATPPPLPSSPLSVRPGSQAGGSDETPVPGRRDPPANDRTPGPTPKPRVQPAAPTTAPTPAPTPEPTPEPTPAPTPEPTPETTPAPTSEPPLVGFGFVVSGSRAWFTNYTWGAVKSSWDFGDGSTSSAWSPRHDYAAPGHYTVTLTAVNRDGVSAHRSRTVTIGD